MIWADEKCDRIGVFDERWPEDGSCSGEVYTLHTETKCSNPVGDCWPGIDSRHDIAGIFFLVHVTQPGGGEGSPEDE